MRVSFSHSLSTPSRPTPSLFLNSIRSELTVGSILFSFSRSRFSLTRFVCLLDWQFLSVCLSLSVFILLLWQKKNGNDWDLASYCPLPRSVWQLLSMCRWKHKCFFTQFWHSFELMEKFDFFTRVNFDLNEGRLITYFYFLDGLCPCVRETYFTSIWTKFLAL